MKIRSTKNALCVAATLLATIGVVCDGRAEPKSSTRESASVSQTRKITDKDITRALESRLEQDPAVSSYEIGIKTRDGIVTLSGTVDNLLAEQRAIQIAQGLRGVRDVKDALAVEPADRLDSTIRDDVKVGLAWDAVADLADMDVHVENGMVTLSGTVKNFQEEEAVLQVAKSVRGVRGIENEIKIQKGNNVPDQKIAKKIRQRLDYDLWIDAPIPEVAVNDGKVKLSGKVGSVTERTRAIYDARVEGVDSVDATDLKVETGARKNVRAALQSDEAIDLALKTAYEGDPELTAAIPEVDVEDGVVTLKGIVASFEARRAAERSARNIDGVRAVRNFLKVHPRTPVSDEELARRIDATLQANPLVQKSDVNVSVENGRARLSGTVDSAMEKAQAEKVVARLNGVIDVRNDLRVEDGRRVWQPIEDYPQTFEPSDATPAQTDAELKESIEDQIFWSPYVDANEVNVSVTNGVATLTGMVDNVRERTLAEDNAFQAGARSVVNRLSIDYFVNEGAGAPGKLKEP